MATFVERMIGAVKLDAGTYEEVEADAGAMGQASLVVVLSSIAAGIGSLNRGGLRAMGIATIAALIGWYVWAFVTYLIGTKVLPGPKTEADVGQLLRTTGFSAAPGLFRVLGIVPGVGPLISFLASLWMLVAMVVAVRQALDYDSTGRAIAVCVVGFLFFLGIGFVLALAVAVVR